MAMCENEFEKENKIQTKKKIWTTTYNFIQENKESRAKSNKKKKTLYNFKEPLFNKT